MLNDNPTNFKAQEVRRRKENFYEKDYFSADALFMTEYLNTKRAFTMHQTQELGFPYWEYPNLHETLFCLGRLVFKEWGRRMTLVTFFDLESGYLGSGKFSTYRRKNDTYMPTKGHVNLAESEIGEYFVLKLQCKNGSSSFIEEIWSVEYDENLDKAVRKIFEEVAKREKGKSS